MFLSKAQLGFTLFLSCLITLCLVTAITNPVIAQVQVGTEIFGKGRRSVCCGALALSSNARTIAIGDNYDPRPDLVQGYVEVYDLVGNNWVQRGQTLKGDSNIMRFADFLAMSSDGEILAVGAYLSALNGKNAGSVYVYRWNGSIWEQMGPRFDGSEENNELGTCISLSDDGMTLAIGEPGFNRVHEDAGQVRVYDWIDDQWVQRGDGIDGESAFDRSGGSIELSADGNTVAIGASRNDGYAKDAGHARIFDWDGMAWVQRGDDLDGQMEEELFGEVKISGDGQTVAIFAIGSRQNGGRFTGALRAYRWLDSTWVQLGKDILGEMRADWLSNFDISADGQRLLVSTRFRFGEYNFAGKIRILDWDGNEWVSAGIAIEGKQAGEGFGSPLVMSRSGMSLASSALNHSNELFEDVGAVRVFDLIPSSAHRSASGIKLSIFPNPVSDIMQIQSEEPFTGIRIYSPNGSLAYKRTYLEGSRNDTRLDLSDLLPGAYILYITARDRSGVLKFIKN